jgi:hypothetical protein
MIPRPSESISGAFSVIGGWFSSIGAWLAETPDDARLKAFADSYPAAQFARILMSHTRVVAGMHHLEELDPEARRNVEDCYIDIQIKMAEISSESQEKARQLIEMRQAMEKNLKTDPSGWTPEYVEKIRKTLDRHLATHSATLQKLVDTVAEAA